MAEARIHLELGTIKFSGEGTEAWVVKQLEYVISKLPELSKIAGSVAVQEPIAATAKNAATQPQQVGSLASYIKAKGGESNQVQRFLATADWIRLKGEKNLKTSAVSKALQDNHQKKLSNPADTLNQNVAKGFCEKSGDGFYITPEGLKALGHPD
jgi:hypothetical protein